MVRCHLGGLIVPIKQVVGWASISNATLSPLATPHSHPTTPCLPYFPLCQFASFCGLLATGWVGWGGGPLFSQPILNPGGQLCPQRGSPPGLSLLEAHPGIFLISAGAGGEGKSTPPTPCRCNAQVLCRVSGVQEGVFCASLPPFDPDGPWSDRLGCKLPTAWQRAERIHACGRLSGLNCGTLRVQAAAAWARGLNQPPSSQGPASRPAGSLVSYLPPWRPALPRQ